jgi:hypothetical protein
VCVCVASVCLCRHLCQVNGNLVGELESGQAFGERALSEDTDKRSATVIAQSQTTCAALGKQAYIESIDASSSFADQAAMRSPQAGGGESDDEEWTDTDESSSEEEEDELADLMAIGLTDSEDEDEGDDEDPDEKIVNLIKDEMGMEPESTIEETLNDAREYMGTEVQEEDPRAEMYTVAFDLGIIVSYWVTFSSPICARIFTDIHSDV